MGAHRRRHPCPCLLGPIVILGLLAGSGCSILDELDKAGNSSTPAKPAATSAPAPTGGSTAQAKLRAYYEQSRQGVAEHDPDDPIVRCKSGGRVEFIRKYDCEMKGGRIQG